MHEARDAIKVPESPHSASGRGSLQGLQRFGKTAEEIAEAIMPTALPQKRLFSAYQEGQDNSVNSGIHYSPAEKLAGALQQANQQDSEEKLFVCPHEKCWKAFKARTKLVSHIHLHLGTQPYKCEYQGCGKAFSERANLDIHMRIHLDLKPFPCPLGCGKAFRTKGNMQEHERRHYSNRPYACQNCGMRYYRKIEQLRHEAKCNRTSPAPCKGPMLEQFDPETGQQIKVLKQNQKIDPDQASSSLAPADEYGSPKTPKAAISDLGQSSLALSMKLQNFQGLPLLYGESIEGMMHAQMYSKETNKTDMLSAKAIQKLPPAQDIVTKAIQLRKPLTVNVDALTDTPELCAYQLHVVQKTLDKLEDFLNGMESAQTFSRGLFPYKQGQTWYPQQPCQPVVALQPEVLSNFTYVQTLAPQFGAIPIHSIREPISLQMEPIQPVPITHPGVTGQAK